MKQNRKPNSNASVNANVVKPESPRVNESGLAESDAYKSAYSLLFDSKSRAKKAIELLMSEKDVADFNEKELNLLCWAYNELGDFDKQLDAARHLWEFYPDGETSTHWICNSLWNKHAFTQDTTPISEFVSAAIERRQGNMRNLLILKASALVVAKGSDMTDVELRMVVSDLLVEAYCAGQPSNSRFNQGDFSIFDSPNFIDFEYQFRDFFTSTERDALKLRMKRAKEKGGPDSERAPAVAE